MSTAKTCPNRSISVRRKGKRKKEKREVCEYISRQLKFDMPIALTFLDM